MSYIYTDADELKIKELFEIEFGEGKYGVEGYGEKGDSNYKNMQNLLGLNFPPRSYVTANVCGRETASRMVKLLQEHGFKVALEQQGKITYPKSKRANV